MPLNVDTEKRVCYKHSMRKMRLNTKIYPIWVTVFCFLTIFINEATFARQPFHRHRYHPIHRHTFHNIYPDTNNIWANILPSLLLAQTLTQQYNDSHTLKHSASPRPHSTGPPCEYSIVTEDGRGVLSFMAPRSPDPCGMALVQCEESLSGRQEEGINLDATCEKTSFHTGGVQRYNQNFDSADSLGGPQATISCLVTRIFGPTDYLIQAYHALASGDISSDLQGLACQKAMYSCLAHLEEGERCTPQGQPLQHYYRKLQQR